MTNFATTGWAPSIKLTVVSANAKRRGKLGESFSANYSATSPLPSDLFALLFLFTVIFGGWWVTYHKALSILKTSFEKNVDYLKYYC